MPRHNSSSRIELDAYPIFLILVRYSLKAKSIRRHLDLVACILIITHLQGIS